MKGCQIIARPETGEPALPAARCSVLPLSKTLHYTKAAEQLHISQPSLSYAIAELEEDLGVQLFARQNRKITLNENGQLFL